MKVSAICFTQKGQEKLLSLSEKWKGGPHELSAFSAGSFPQQPGVRRIRGSAKEWTGKAFAGSDAILFTGAAGIAVRLCAPFIKDKKTDPAVVVMDESGSYVIPLLSGHFGGANELALEIADALHAQPVITTATDREGLFAVDVFAKKNSLSIREWDLAKEVSARLLQGRKVGFQSDFPWKGEVPPELIVIPEGRDDIPADPAIVRKNLEAGEKNPEAGEKDREEGAVAAMASRGGLPEIRKEVPVGIYISRDLSRNPFPQTLHLYPKDVTAGIGCKKGKSEEELSDFLKKCLLENRISPCCLKQVSSIDLKAGEKGLQGLCRFLGVPLRIFPAEELEKVEGDFSDSDFVRSVAGTGCVCERAAVLASGNRILLMKKKAENGMTAALAGEIRRLRF